MKSSGVDLLDVGKLLREFQANQKHLRGVNGQNEKEANYYASDCTCVGRTCPEQDYSADIINWVTPVTFDWRSTLSL